MSEQLDKQAEIAVCLKKLSEQNGGVLLPEDVVAAARSPKSPLHNWFTWDDDDAAQKWRLVQARELIRSIKIEVQTNKSAPVIISPVYVHMPTAEGEKRSTGYVSIATLRKDEDLARDALVEEFSRAAAYLRRAYGIAAALKMQDRVQNVLKEVEGLSAEVQDSN